MIRICERCYGQVDDRSAHVRLAHIDHALPDGSIVWRHSFVHTEVCDAAGRGRSPIDVPDTGEWDSRRGLSAAALGWIASRRAELPTESVNQA